MRDNSLSGSTSAERPAPCPLCASTGAHYIGRSLYHCPACGIAFNAAHRSLSYTDSYFLDEYRGQYGRTYLEDFSAIYSASVRRLESILSLMKMKNGLSGLRLLDIGSAMGFFLKAASDLGIGSVSGIEISSYAAEYCEKELGIAVANRPFQRGHINGDYDIITAWFFIEHCQDPAGTISDIAGRVRPGGVMAFSVPSIQGPLFRFNRTEWVQSHPGDHRIDFSPGALRRILKDEGFKKIMVLPCGFHPERVLSPGSLLFPLFRPLYRAFARAMAFSDTLEVYALK